MRHKTIGFCLRDKNLNKLKDKKKELSYDLISEQLYQAQLKPNYLHLKISY